MAARKSSGKTRRSESQAAEAVLRPRLPEGISPAEVRELAGATTRAWHAEISQRSKPVTDDWGCMANGALLKLVRRGLTSDNLIELEATRRLLRFAQEAMVLFGDHPAMAGARRRWLHVGSGGADADEDDE